MFIKLENYLEFRREIWEISFCCQNLELTLNLDERLLQTSKEIITIYIYIYIILETFLFEN